ncbi:MAG: bifunctional adenosylcobinamide kinase/adenosylcobinamide-phosphate guanylyltransferase [Marinosulfonomonas sp.]|nr:bifunctional adenosylcobinamide kinase/adenosylcobinamide-phosphate guanylyltransferase [Marinosulfonomonas sp.]
MFPKVTLVLGGISSGKSDFAEELALQSTLSAVYLASAQANDPEMRAKIERHRSARDARWKTIEEPLNAAGTIENAAATDIVLFDCATLWLTNHLLGGSDLTQEQDRLITAIKACRAHIVIVSNEVGQGGVSENKMARSFAAAQGQLNRKLAENADLVVMVVAGLPMVLKGELPAEAA